jgi:hypothetical protein
MCGDGTKDSTGICRCDLPHHGTGESGAPDLRGRSGPALVAGDGCEQTGWRIHAYVLMGNHYHVLAETPEPNLIAGMKWLQSTYTQRYNARHKVFGHLFQGRYKALAKGSSPES